MEGRYLPQVRSLQPIEEAGILEGRNGIKETFIQQAARYLAKQPWVVARPPPLEYPFSTLLHGEKGH